MWPERTSIASPPRVCSDACSGRNPGRLDAGCRRAYEPERFFQRFDQGCLDVVSGQRTMVLWADSGISCGEMPPQSRNLGAVEDERWGL